PGAARVVYDDPMPYAKRLAEESERERAAREAGTPYAPADRRWRAIRREGGADVLVEEPKTSTEALDDPMVASSKPRTGADGRSVVTLSIRDDRLDAWRAFVARNAGLSMAVVVDDVLVATPPVPAQAGDHVDLALRPDVSDGSAKGAAEDLAIVL